MFEKALWYSHEDTIDVQDLAMDDLKSSTNWKMIRGNCSSLFQLLIAVFLILRLKEGTPVSSFF